MTMTEKRKEYLYQYAKEKLKRIPLNVTLSEYDDLKAAAAGAGLSVNGFIKLAIKEKIARESKK